MDLKAPGHPPVPPLPNWTTWGPLCPAHWSKDRGLLVASSWPVLGMSEQPPQARARKKVQDSKRKVGASGCGCWVGASGSSFGKRAQQSCGPRAHHYSSPPGTAGSEIARPCRGGEDALTCSSVADARAYPARPPRLQPSPRQPPPPAWHHVEQSSQSRDVACAEHPGRKGGAWEATLRSLQASEVKLELAEWWRLRMSRCRAKLPVLLSTVSHWLISTNIVPGPADKPNQAGK